MQRVVDSKMPLPLQDTQYVPSLPAVATREWHLIMVYIASIYMVHNKMIASLHTKQAFMYHLHVLHAVAAS